MQPKHLPEQNPSPRIIAKNSDRKFPSRQARVGCSPRGGVDPNAAWIPRSSPRAHAPPRPAKSNTRRGGGEPRRRLRGKECLLCRAPVWGGVVWVCLACAVCLGGSSLEAACRFGSGRLVGGRVLWTACVGEQVRGGVCEAHGNGRWCAVWAMLLRARTGPGLIWAPGGPTCR